MGLIKQQGKHNTAYARKASFQEECMHCHQSTAPCTMSPQRHNLLNTGLLYEPQTALKGKSFPITTRKGEGVAYTELIKRATKTGAPTLKGRDSLLLPPSPLQREQIEREASGYIHRHPAQSAASQVMAARRSTKSNYSPEIATYFY